MLNFHTSPPPRERPTITRSMRQALEDLGLERLFIIHAGESSFPLDARVTAVAFPHLLDTLAQHALRPAGDAANGLDLPVTAL